MSTLEALQATLAAEHAAVFAYGDAGAHTSQSADPGLFATISSLYRDHRSRRDQLQLLISDRGATPVAAAAAYDLPAELTSAEAVRRQARTLEERCAEIYAALVANTTGADRAWAVSALGAAAVARIALGGAPETFPGAPDLDV